MLKKVKIIILMLSLVTFVAFMPARGDAASVAVNCGTASLQAAINAAVAGTVITVSGTCNENVSISQAKNRITIDGGGAATINGTDVSNHTIDIKGRGITIKKLTITGGNDGINITRGGSATIDTNIILNTAHNGISVGQVSHADIIGNTIQNNANQGIAVNDNSSAHIGFVGFSDTVAKPNIIKLNGGNGIVVNRSSSAEIVGNKINNNTLDGIAVRGASHAEISKNTINGNKDNGIHVYENSGVNLGNFEGTTIFDLSNSTTIKNGINGGSCEFGGYVAGRLGTLDGVEGPAAADSTCLVNLLQ